MNTATLPSIMVICSIVLSACGIALQVTPTGTPTKAMPTRPSPMPSSSPIPPTMEATKDSNAPDGFTRFENGVYYQEVKTEKGNTLTYTWDKERGTWERQIFLGPIIPASLEQKPYGLVGDLMMTVTIDNTIAGETQLQTINPHQKWEPDGTPNWANLFRDLLFAQMENAGLIQTSRKVDWRPFFDGSHKYHFDFKTAEGQQSEGIWQGAELHVRIRGDFNQLKETKPIGFSEVSSQGLVGEPASDYMIKIWTKDGNTYIDIAPSLPASKWTPQDIMWMIMYGPSVIWDCSGGVTKGQECDLSTLPNGSQSLSGFIANMKQSPLFDLTSPQ